MNSWKGFLSKTRPSDAVQRYNDVAPHASASKSDLQVKPMVIRLAGLKIESDTETELLADLPEKVRLAGRMAQDQVDRLRLLIAVYAIRYEMSHQTMMARYEAGELRMTKEMLKWLLACRTLELLLGHPPTYGLPEQNRNIHYSSRIYKVWPH